MNYNNLSQKTNYTAGSGSLDLASIYLTTVNIPGINFGHPEIGGRSGGRLNVTGDTIVYNTLSFEMLIDEDFKLYQEFMTKVFNNVNQTSGQFASQEFDFWIDINNNKGHKLFKIEFFNCRIESIGDIQLDTTDDITEHTLSVEIKYDYYTMDYQGYRIPTLRT